MRNRLAMALAGAAVSRVIGSGAEVVTPQELAQKQAEPTRGQRKTLTRSAIKELVRESRAYVPLPHIHPRWLRDEVARRMDAGETITAERIEQLRAIGAGK